MDVTGEQGSSTSTEAAGGSETVTQTTAATEVSTDSPGDGTGGEAPAPAYTPNFKYKVLKEEKEIPEWARGGITSAELEKQARDVFERAGGLDSVKSHRDILLQENQQLKEQWGPAVQTVQTLSNHLQKGDLDSFFRDTGITEQDVLKYALHRLELREKPEVLQAHTQMQTLKQQNEQYQAQLQQYQQQYQEAVYNQRAQEFENVLQRPDVNEAVAAFDSRVGIPGAFRAEVINRGRMYAAAGQDISAERAAMEVLQMIGFQSQGSAQQTQTPTQQTEVEPQAKPATLPNLRGRGASPVKKVFKSTDELREYGRRLS